MNTVKTGRTSAGRAGTPRAKPKRNHPAVVAGSKHGKTDDPRNEFSDEEWYDMVSTAAYYRAEARGFGGGSAEDHWYEAEAELRDRFNAAGSSVETASVSGGDATDSETTGD